MEVSVGLYALIFILFFLVIPGYIARRFYYHGEFSKTINWNKYVITNLLISLFVGMFLTLLFISCFNLFSKARINLDEILNKFDSYFVTINNEKGINKFSGFTTTLYKTYLPFLGAVYTFSAVLGYFASKLVILFGLDIRWKLFRFSNNWYYLFHGKILKFRKTSTNEILQKSNKKVKHTYLDVLVAERGDDTTLYSGLFANYDVSFDDINKLEKLHLYRASRYKKEDNLTVNKPIPGDVFTLIATSILNINVTYLFYEDEVIKHKQFSNLKMIIIPAKIMIVLYYMLILVSIVFSINIFYSPNYYEFLQSWWLTKLMFLLSLNVVVGLILPFKINDDAKKVEFIGLKEFFIQILALIILGFITVSLYF